MTRIGQRPVFLRHRVCLWINVDVPAGGVPRISFWGMLVSWSLTSFFSTNTAISETNFGV